MKLNRQDLTAATIACALMAALATLLLLVSIDQRFKVHAVRVGLMVVVLLLLCVPIYRVLTLPRGGSHSCHDEHRQLGSANLDTVFHSFSLIAKRDLTFEELRHRRW